jgi:hypothetical protein
MRRLPRSSNRSPQKMPLSRFTFLVKAPGYSPHKDRSTLSSPQFTTVVIGVSDLISAMAAANEEVQAGTQLIELCGGFTQSEAAELRNNLSSNIPVGVVTYTPEQEAELARLFE